MHSFLLRLGQESLFSGTITIGDYSWWINPFANREKKVFKNMYYNIYIYIYSKHDKADKELGMWILSGSNWLHIKHAIFWPLHLTQAVLLVWSMHLQCQGFSDVFSAGDGLWPRHPQIHRLLWKISWWIISRLVGFPADPHKPGTRYANATESCLKNPPTRTSLTFPGRAHFPPVDPKCY